MSVAKEQREKLIWEFPNIGKKAPEQEEKAFAYCEGYKEFLNVAKTEREFVREAVLRLKEAGYEEFEEGKIYQPGDKVADLPENTAGTRDCRYAAGGQPSVWKIRLHTVYCVGQKCPLCVRIWRGKPRVRVGARAEP